MKETVKYDNYMNSLYFRNFKAVEFDLLITLCSRLKEKGSNIVTFPLNELKKISGDTKHSYQDFINSLKSMNRKLMEITCEIETSGKNIMFTLFPTFIIDHVNQTLTISVNEYFRFVLNDLTKNFTLFDLKEFLELNSKYSKTLYRLLKQYRSIGKYIISIEGLKNIMDSPKAYNNKQFMQNIINPALKELKMHGFFKDLDCIVQYSHKKGCPVIGYTFTFKPEERVNRQQNYIHQEPQENRKPVNHFNGIPERKYDYDNLEQNLLANGKKTIVSLDEKC